MPEWTRELAHDFSVPGFSPQPASQVYEVVALEPGNHRGGKVYTFRGHIISTRGAQSSYASIDQNIDALNGAENPCDLSIVTKEDKKRVEKIIALHPEFEYAGGPVQRGDSFWVHINSLHHRHGKSRLNIQGIIPVLELRHAIDGLTTTITQKTCKSLMSAFEGEDALLLGGGKIEALSDDEIEECAKEYGTNADISYKSNNDPKIAELHASFQSYVMCFINKCHEEGIKIKMTSSYRTIEKQIKMREDWEIAPAATRGIRPANISYHNFGLAFDFNAWDKQGVHLDSKKDKALWEASGIPAIGKNLGLQWGGDFSDNYDPIHFDAKGVGGMPSTTTLSSKAKSQGVEGNQVTV